MHKDFYASGFLYHSRTQQILLQKGKQTDPDTTWLLPRIKSLKNETEKETFKRLLNILFCLDVKTESIFPVYNYYHEALKKNNYISYVKVQKTEDYSCEDVFYEWFYIGEILKHSLSPQTKQDITVMQRVIDSSIRKLNGEKFIE
jgi:hypothetical protein